MKTYSNCICCNSELEPEEAITPCYDDGGSLDSFDVSQSYPTYPYCEGCEGVIPDECKESEWVASYSPFDDLPF